jgi:aspartate-semialdehyde dehydrogenase
MMKVGIIGATGMVGQRFIQLLEEHPWFEIKALMASSRSAKKSYGEVAKWYLKEEIPDGISGMIVEEINEEVIKEFNLDLVFSAIPSNIAREIEASFAQEIPVFSNTATYRMEEDVPLIIPEVNPDHLTLVKEQGGNRGWNGFIVTNPNCTTIGLVPPLKPIMDEYGIDWVNVATMQALSGAGYDGVPSMAIIDNVIPFIKNEDEKVEEETVKILGGVKKAADFDVFASCNRVSVRDGHTESVFVQTKKDFSIEDVKEVFRGFRGEPQELKLPFAPEEPIVVMDKVDRPQPLFDRGRGKGMSISVGRIRRGKARLLKFTCLSHNTIRGAAGASILNAELAYKKNIL